MPLNLSPSVQIYDLIRLHSLQVCFNRIGLAGFDIFPNLFSVSAASQLHRKLMYTNEHQKCLLETHKRELESKKFELVTLKALVAQKKESSMCSAEEEGSRADALERELQMVR